MLRGADLDLSQRTIEDIFDQGLHQFLMQFIATNRRLADTIGQEYRFIA